MKPGITLHKSGDGGKALRERLALLSRSDVLVGIPQNRNSRSGEPIGNAALLYIHTNGSPARNIPARPVIEPAIAADGNRQIISGELKLAAKAMLAGDPNQVLIHLRMAGQAGQNAAQTWFFDARRNWPALKPATIRAKGSSQELIKTGSMRKAITYIVRMVR